MFRTYSGKIFNPLRVEDLEVCIEDIAHALSNVCRYNGHLNTFYSVAQHSILVSRMVPKQYALEALFHDASEAYLPDMPTSIKEYLPDFRALEERLINHIYKSLDIYNTYNITIKEADIKIREAEIYSLSGWPVTFTTFPDTISPMEPRESKTAFLNEYKDIVAKSIFLY